MAETWGGNSFAAAPDANAWGALPSNGHGAADKSDDHAANGDNASDAGQVEVIDPTAGNEEFAKAAKDRGWTEKVPYDYKSYEAEHQPVSDWHSASKRYEWSDEYGDVAPRVPMLEQLLFGGEFRMKKGSNFENLEGFNILLDGPEKVLPIRDFDEAGLHPVVLENIKLCHYTEPTPIQSYCIPIALQGNDLVATAQTGSGKTAAYMIPAISRLMGKAKKLCAPKPNMADPSYNPSIHRVRAEPLVVVVVPTRELAMQIFDEARRMCYRSMLRPTVIYGGLPYSVMIEDIGKGADILISTPGRLVDLMDKPHLLSMSRVKYTIIDEADEMLHADWEAELRKIMSGGDTNSDADHVFMLFSATFPEEAFDSAGTFLARDHYRVTVGRAGSTHANIAQDLVWVDHNEKRNALWDLIISLEPARTLIFCNSKITVDLVDDFLYNRGLPTTSIHSARNQREREDALRAFRTGACPILVATGVSARGWDIKDLQHVINYDLPSAMHGGIDEYIHRIGRTARIGHKGMATSFYNERNEDIAPELVKTLLECGCQVPDFLEQFKEDVNNESGDTTGVEDIANGMGGVAIGSAFGGGVPSPKAEDAMAGAAWGLPTPTIAGDADSKFEVEGGAPVSGTW